MRSLPLLSIVAAVLLAGILYAAVPTTPPAGPAAASSGAPHQGGEDATGPMAMGGTPVAAASTETILAQARQAVGDHGLAEIRKVEDSIAQAATDSVQMAPGFGRLARLWAGHHQGSAAGHFLALEAGLEKSPKKLTFAGRFFLNLVADAAADSPSVRMWNARQAVACFQQAQALAPADSNQIDLATAYIEGTGETMQGVQLLLGIVRKDSGNVPALLILGKLAIQSAQWDKAIGRFEQGLQQEPQNREALYFLAEAYKGKGDRAQARATFERVKKVVNNPEFSRDLDEYLKTF